MEHSAIVVGGGIAGLASAIALTQQGWTGSVSPGADAVMGWTPPA